MGFWQRAWRRQKAVNRARNIRRFRKGRPKLGCYKCWYDCYEIESERCPECNAVIEREVPWWRDGRFPLWAGAVCWFLYEPVRISGPYLTVRHVVSQSTANLTTAPFYYMIGAMVLSYGFIVLGVWFTQSRTRHRKNFFKRHYVMAGSVVAGLLVAWLVYTPLMDTLIEPPQGPTTTPSPHSPSPANPAPGSAP